MMCVTTALIEAVAGLDVRREIDQRIDIPVVEGSLATVPRAALASALCALLFHDLIQRVPDGKAYVDDQVSAGRKVCFDHGAIRTVDGFTGSMPQGDAAFARILEPLGYIRTGIYPLERLRMTGRVFTHADDPEGIAQFFVSELHVDRFSLRFQEAAKRVMSTTAEPLPVAAITLLERLRRDKTLDMQDAVQLVPWLLRCFARHHQDPLMEDYEVLLAESSEMAWIATEGNAFNHATDRVRDIRKVAQEQRNVGRSLKKDVEVSRSGRVLQTAFRAATVRRRFRSEGGHIERDVPGSFYEFIQRERTASGRLDLAFDSGNATGIFGMTAGSKHAG